MDLFSHPFLLTLAVIVIGLVLRRLLKRKGDPKARPAPPFSIP